MTPDPTTPERLNTAVLRDAADEFCDGPYAASGILGDHRCLLGWAADELDQQRAEAAGWRSLAGQLAATLAAQGSGSFDEATQRVWKRRALAAWQEANQ